jgi:O-acetyl-ADP-ribose deacetylase (regulator of RNase III)
MYSLKGYMVQLVQGDITDLEVDAIVNAANSYLEHGGGVAYAIVKKGGQWIQEESREWVKRNGQLPVGGIAVTGCGRLKCKYLIHAVGPRYGEGDEKLYQAILNSLRKADELSCNSVALPAISTGIFGYPYSDCAKVMVRALMDFEPSHVSSVIICLYGEQAYRVFKEIFDLHLKPEASTSRS